MSNGFFQDVGTSLFKPIGDFVGSAVTALQPGRVQQMQRQQRQQDMNQQLQILGGEFSPEEKENAARKFIQMVNPKWYEQRLKEDPETKFWKPAPDIDPVERAGKVGLAIQRMDNAGMFDDNNELRESLTAYALKDVPGVQQQTKEDKTKLILSDYFTSGLQELEDKAFGRASQEQVGEFEKGFKREAKKQGMGEREAELLFGNLYKEERGKASIFRDDVLPRRDVINPLQDYFQDSTGTVPERNVPSTFEQLGITNTQDQATLSEMQKAVPDIDLLKEYENDPEGMQKLMKLWREKKLNKSNLHKAFSMIQQSARQSLGLA